MKVSLPLCAVCAPVEGGLPGEDRVNLAPQPCPSYADRNVVVIAGGHGQIGASVDLLSGPTAIEAAVAAIAPAAAAG